MIRRWLARRRAARLEAFWAAWRRQRAAERHFADVVLPRRVAAITERLNERFADLLPEGARFEWVSAGQDGDGQ